MKKVIIGMLTMAAILSFQSCNNDDDTPTPDVNVEEQLKKEVVENYANIVYTNYKDSYDLAQVLQGNIETFLATPTASNFNMVKQAWYDAREPYGQTEAFRFAGGPIDTGEDSVEGMLNAWPLDESFIDYVSHSGESNVNIINNVSDYPVISKEVLREVNESTETSISLGYHAIEFLLWGQDTQIPTQGPEHTTGGNRPYTDFVDGGTATHQDRRRQYLQVATELLIEDLKYLVDEWDVNGNNYRADFISQDVDKSISQMLAGIGVLAGSELSEERILVAVSKTSQEDEHSCFSDNTHRDIITNYMGIENVFMGTYKSVDGTVVSGSSISDLLKMKDEAKLSEMVNSMQTIENEIESTTIPFDYAITQASDVAKFNLIVNELRDLGADFAAISNTIADGVYVAPEG
ncbi:hypothetical protein GO491_03365 [Flavobacteriaceae bacterium Ap0902]|nr:hypothetical protein [Flavobacteriaceae bacterium Ap0902]